MFDLISQILAFMCTVKNEICSVGGPECHQLLSISHLLLLLCWGGSAVMSLLSRSCLNWQIGGVSLGFVPGLWERGREEEQPCVPGTAMFKAQAFYISTVETVKEFWHLSFSFATLC